MRARLATGVEQGTAWAALPCFAPCIAFANECSRNPPTVDVRFLSAQPRFTSPRFRLDLERFATPDGEVERPVIHHPGAVGVIVVPAPGRLLLVRQYRYALRRETLEIVAGTRVPDEAPEATAHRELREEAGRTARSLREVLRFYPAPGVSDELMIVYRADGLGVVPAAPEHGELVRGEEVSVADLPRLRHEGLLCDAKTLLALALLGLGVAGA
jgi:ADP-ribose pyrophosphatase